MGGARENRVRFESAASIYRPPPAKAAGRALDNIGDDEGQPYGQSLSPSPSTALKPDRAAGSIRFARGPEAP